MGMWCLSKVPGWYVRRDAFSWRFVALSRRSMVAGLIERSCCWICAKIAKRLLGRGSHNGKKALSRAEHG